MGSYGGYMTPQVSRIGAGNRSLALAAGRRGTGIQDPFGIIRAGGRPTGPAGAPSGLSAAAVQPPAGIERGGGPATSPAGANPGPMNGDHSNFLEPANPAPTPSPFDVNLDPIVQAVNALTGMSDSEAHAAALKQTKDILLAYGDPNLAKVLHDPTFQKAVQANPTSTLAQLSQQRGRNTKTLTDNLNAANLLYSGDRVVQETQLGQDYQNQLASAAGNVRSGLETIDNNLAAALSQNQMQRLNAMTQAEQQNASSQGPGGVGALYQQLLALLGGGSSGS